MKMEIQMMLSVGLCVVSQAEDWVIDSNKDWNDALAYQTGIEIKEGLAALKEDRASYLSIVHKFDSKRKIQSLTIKQSDKWLNWRAIDKVQPKNLRDAPVFLVRGDKDYWIFGRMAPMPKHGKGSSATAFEAKPAKLKGFDVPLLTTRYENQYDARGGLNRSLGGYHAWQSRDMIHWVHHGPVTEGFSRWVTTAELVDGKAYIYYDFPNDQDPHLYIDEDLFDGKPGKNMGMALNDPSHGSDCAVIRGLDGRFHIIFEDWSPINARKHSWDSPIAGHAVGRKGYNDFEIVEPAVDARTRGTGKMETYLHPHWVKEDPKRFKTNVAEYEVHEPEQDAFGDWAAIAIGGQYYLFADFHPANDKIRIGWFTSESIDKPFEFCGEIGSGHPDPDIGFAEGSFYLLNQTAKDYISSGPWVNQVEARVGADTDGDGKVDKWTDWQLMSESYERIQGFSKQVKRNPSLLNASGLPEAEGVAFELKLCDVEGNVAKPELDKVTLKFTK